MEFLLLAVLGLATLGEVLAPEKKDDKDKDKDKKDGKEAKGKDGKGKDGKDDKDDKEEPQKTPEQELMEAIAKYESQAHSGKKIKFHYEIEDK